MTMLNANRAAASDDHSGVRFFFPLDDLECVKAALGEHLTPTWRGRDEYLGLRPCPCQTHVETIVHDGIAGFYVWHGCGGLFLPIEDMERRDHDRDVRLLSAICNWLVSIHQERSDDLVFD